MVSYSDILAHEFEDSVSRSVKAIAALRDVEEVVQDAREVLLVRAPEVPVAVVSDALRAFWQAEAASRPWTAELEAAVAAAGPLLRRAGFRKRRASWNREASPGVVHVVEFRRFEHGDGDRLAISAAVFLDEIARVQSAPPRRSWVHEIDGHLRVSSETLARLDSERTWPLASAAPAAVDFVRDVLLPFLDARTTLDAIVRSDDDTPVATRLHEVDVAIVLAAQGRTQEALAKLQCGFDAAVYGRRHVVEVASTLGLQVETGARPELSRAEEHFLDIWVATEAERVDRFRSWVAATGGPNGRKLDGSLRSVARLWPWVVEVIRQTDAGSGDDAQWMFCALPESMRPWVGTAPTPATLRLLEGLSGYVGFVLRTAVPRAAWDLVVGSHFRQPAVVGIGSEPALVVERSMRWMSDAERGWPGRRRRLPELVSHDITAWLDGR